MTIGAATDPYQPAEGRYRLTRSCLAELPAADTPFSIITRGPLIVRDLDVLQDAARRVHVGVHVSVPTLDDRVWRTTEPGTAPPARRLEVVRRLAEAGVDVGVAVAPVLPGLSDRPEQLATVVRAARAAGARSIWASLLNLGRARESTSSRRWRATGPRSSSATSASTTAVRTSRTASRAPCGRRCADSPRRPRVAHRPVLRPAPQPAQLSLAV